MRNLLVIGLFLFEALFVQCEPMLERTFLEPKEPTLEEIPDTGDWSLQQMQKHVQDLEKRLDSVAVVAESPSVPQGFIYIQLPDQPEPSAIWSGVKWEEISSKYAGLFFRTVGNEAAAFGKIQEDFAPSNRILQYNNRNIQWKDQPPNCFNKNCDIESNGWSGFIWTGDSTHGAYSSNWIRFLSETKRGEVRPKNTAVRIWKRV